MWADILTGLLNNLTVESLVVLLVGTMAGIVLGALPGISATSAVALLLPFTFAMDPAMGLVLLAAVYMSAEYGGSISAILINTPGTPGAACTAIEGWPLSQKGHAQEALYVSLLGGAVGGMFGALVLLFLTREVAQVAFLLGPAEIFWIAVTGLALVGSMSGQSIIKGLIGVTLGVGLTLVGQDIVTGNMRFTYGNYYLVGGITLVPALLGLFAVASILSLVENPDEAVAPLIVRKGILRQAINRLMGMKSLLLWSSAQGCAIGILPGAGASIAAFVAYGTARRLSKTPEEFGKGSFEGVAAPETANNSVVGGAMVPLLSLGIPGSGSAAIMFGALTVHGILPGPRLFAERAELAYTFMVGLSFTVIAMVVVGLLTIRWSSLIVKVPRTMMVPGVLVLAVFGSFVLANSVFDVYILMGVGLIGYFLIKLQIPVVTIALGLVLGALIEQTYQQSAIVASVTTGSLFSFYLSRPLNILLMLVCAGVLLSSIRPIIMNRRAEKLALAAMEGRPVTANRVTMRFANIFLALFVLGLAGLGFVEVQSLSARGAQFPILVATLLLIFGLLLLLYAVLPQRRMDDRLYPFDEVPWRTICIVLAALIVMTFALQRIGFYESALLFSGFVCWLLLGSSQEAREAPLKRLTTAALFAVGLTIVIYITFAVVLGLRTPPGLLL
jgi:putative tricarboxylic transport membrane protein